MRLRPLSLRTRLTVSAVLGAAVVLATLVAAFNLLLDARLRTDADNVLRERAATVLRSLGTVGGRLAVGEAPDQGAIDAQTWIFAGERMLEQPAGVDPRNQQAARGLARGGRGFMTVNATDTRMEAVPVRQSARPLGTVVVTASTAPYNSTASSALLGSAILGLLVLAAVAVMSRWLIRRALRPVAQMTAQAADWGEHDLSRRFFHGEPYDELSTLASVFDGLLARLAQSLRRERHLTAEISHELRTPLAKILAEAELAATDRRSGEPPPKAAVEGSEATRPHAAVGRSEAARPHAAVERSEPARPQASVERSEATRPRAAVERSPAYYQAALERVRRYAQDLQRVLETLLASARAGTPAGNTVASDAQESAERAAQPLRETLAAQGKSIELVTRRPTRVAVEADVVERILSPLLENAVRFASQRITVEIRAVAGEVVFEVCDDGPGVKPLDQERIFDPGFRGAPPFGPPSGRPNAPPSAPPNTAIHAGAGLGLSLVRRLARASGGDVRARPSEEGGRFDVRLPAG
jgi:signal transduction histidine kinase